MLSRQQEEGEEEEDETSRWLAEHDPEATPQQKEETKKTPEAPKVTKPPKTTFYEQLKGDIPEELQTKKSPEKELRRHKRQKKEPVETEEVSVSPEDFGVSEEELKKLGKSSHLATS